jgi:hypothetical protein
LRKLKLSMGRPINKTEEFFIKMLRGFDFLRHLGYEYASFAVYGPEPFITFEHNSLKRGVAVGYQGGVDVDIYIPPLPLPDHSKRHFKVREIYRHFQGSQMAGPPESDLPPINWSS